MTCLNLEKKRQGRLQGAFPTPHLGERFGGDVLPWDKVKLEAERGGLELRETPTLGKSMSHRTEVLVKALGTNELS